MCEELALFLIFQIPSLISVGRIRVERIGGTPTEGQIEEKCQSFFGKSDNDVFDGHFNHKNLNDVCVAKTAASGKSNSFCSYESYYSLYPVLFSIHSV